MSKETIELGATPYNEECAQVGEYDYYHKAQKECQTFISQLKRVYKSAHQQDIPDSLKLRIKSYSHDFGNYYEVAASFDSANEEAQAAFYWLEENVPANWDEQAKQELTPSSNV